MHEAGIGDHLGFIGMIEIMPGPFHEISEVFPDLNIVDSGCEAAINKAYRLQALGNDQAAAGESFE